MRCAAGYCRLVEGILALWGRGGYQECSQCLGEINKNEIYRSLVAKFDGSLRQFRWCSDCCVAMITELENWNSEDIIDEFPFEKRFNLFKSGVV